MFLKRPNIYASISIRSEKVIAAIGSPFAAPLTGILMKSAGKELM